MSLPRRYYAIALWLAFLLACIAIIGRTHFTTDLSAFLPRSPTAQQQLLVDQIRDGFASRLILIGLEGGETGDRAALSKKMAQQLRADPQFASINNGEAVYADSDRAYLFNHRYLLSAQIAPGHFSVQGLHSALSDSIDLLSSPAGLWLKPLFTRDPTGEMLQIAEQIRPALSPKRLNGVWASADGQRALLLAQTRADGSDTDAQQRAMDAIRQAYRSAAGDHPQYRLLMTGPGVFSVTARDAIKTQVTRLSLIGSSLIAFILLLVYRSPTALLLGLLPVASGALAGIAAVSLGFGEVHGVTLGFGTALIGEAVDYSIYLFVQSGTDSRREDWIGRFWPVVRLGVLTSVAGFASLLFSSFPGLAQLGLYAITGLVVAAAVTRFVLPLLLPDGFRIRDVAPMGLKLASGVRRARHWRWGVALIAGMACVTLYMHRTDLWSRDLSALSPVSARELALDAELRKDSGAPDVRYLIVVPAGSEEAALEDAERAATPLQALIARGALAGFDSPARYLPSAATQRARQAALPDAPTLTQRLPLAIGDLPVHAQRFAPFMADIAAARRAPLVHRADLDHTSLAMAVDALLLHRGAQWSALLPLTANAGGSISRHDILTAFQRARLPQAEFVDLKSESDRLYADYLNQAIELSAAGLLLIIVLLGFSLRSIPRILRVIAPLAAAVVTVAAGLSLAGRPLLIMHLIGLLLVVAIGSNYALFFDRGASHGDMAPRTLASLFFANLTTVAGFGLLAFSSVPILQALGLTVAPGVVCALIYSALLSDKEATPS
ncbi:MAG: MMPL family transporter [Burkholderiales bacterium]